MANEFWLSDAQWAAIDPLRPKNRPGARRVDDRRVISGIVHVLRTGCRWQDCPSCYGPPTTIYNRLNDGRRAASGRSCFEPIHSTPMPKDRQPAADSVAQGCRSVLEQDPHREIAGCYCQHTLGDCGPRCKSGCGALTSSRFRAPVKMSSKMALTISSLSGKLGDSIARTL